MRIVTVKLTLPQLWLIVEQMDKGAFSWDLSKFNYMAARISKKLRIAAASLEAGGK
ncbi:MAG: hypothetical protein KGL39_19930 [Patescibacteria group bacterium]|nr:hypothetical protein [Patescibacteria group bacterium]